MDLFLPLEVVNREYIGRLFLAVASASSGYDAYFGHKPEVFKFALKSSPDNVWFGRGSVNTQLLDKGIKLVGQDEEAGLISNEYSDFYKLRPGLKSIGSIDRFFCWGNDDFNFLKSEHSNNGRVEFVLSGSTRTITWGSVGKSFYESDINSIKNKYGDYLVLVSNLSHANSFLGNNLIRHLKGMDSWSESTEIIVAALEKEKRLLKLYITAAAEIAKKFSINVVIRPHPTENPKTWIELVKSFENVYVEFGGSISPWILGAQCVVHNSSTVGIESCCSDIPTIAFGETHDDLHDGPLTYSNKMSLQAVNLKNLLEAFDAKNYLWGQKKRERKKQISRKVVGYNSTHSLSEILKNIDNIEKAPSSSNDRTNKLILKNKKRTERTLSISKIKRYLISKKLNKEKRPRLCSEAIKNDIYKISQILNIEQNITHCVVDKNTFKIYKK
jgi:surface carbohydrate biosynthesis protein